MGVRLKVTGYALFAAGFLGIPPLIFAIGALNPPVSASSLEERLVTRYLGTEPLAELIRSQAPTLGHDQRDQQMLSVNTHYLLANACASGQHPNNPVCAGYAEIPNQMIAQLTAQEKYDRILPELIMGSVMVMTLGGLLVMLNSPPYASQAAGGEATARHTSPA